ncbi:uncharacterized protein G2W53_021724 [Senna tora]|uniref:Uncharacterized protein n=1 Tax=Senna tora TaxID=362788 RepID=A0A834WHI1_9FABA|nr:uncharacterized protein G2W53_021724 [Senna tora]
MDILKLGEDHKRPSSFPTITFDFT